MGFTPREVGRMSLWELSACSDGWARSQGAEAKPAAPSRERLLAFLAED